MQFATAPHNLACKRAGQYEDEWSDDQGFFPG
jgi:hypothetical protein